ncbi:hypothetical protein [Nocardia sp. SSK8]|uniref:hypothetical protein n=1 Tax=Nocardia sp. SSK8 TaxID=3120154 RepID=UPI00300B82F8
MNHAEHDETIGSMLASIAAALREVSEKLDVVAARVQEEVPPFPGDEDVPDQIRIRRLESWAFHASQDISRLSSRLDALDGGDPEPTPAAPRGTRSRREVREAAEAAERAAEAALAPEPPAPHPFRNIDGARPPLERRQSALRPTATDHLGDPTWPITVTPVPRTAHTPGAVATVERETAQLEMVETETDTNSRVAGDRVTDSHIVDDRVTDTGSVTGAADASDAESTSDRSGARSGGVAAGIGAITPSGEPESSEARGFPERAVSFSALSSRIAPEAGSDRVTVDEGGRNGRVVGEGVRAGEGTRDAVVDGVIGGAPGADVRAVEDRPEESAGAVQPGAGPGIERARPAGRLTDGPAGSGEGDSSSHAAPTGFADNGIGSRPTRPDSGSSPTPDPRAAGLTAGDRTDASTQGTNGFQWTFAEDTPASPDPTPPRNGHARNGFTTDSSRRDSLFDDFTPRDRLAIPITPLATPEPPSTAPRVLPASPSETTSPQEPTAPTSANHRITRATTERDSTAPPAATHHSTATFATASDSTAPSHTVPHSTSSPTSVRASTVPDSAADDSTALGSGTQASTISDSTARGSTIPVRSAHDSGVPVDATYDSTASTTAAHGSAGGGAAHESTVPHSSTGSAGSAPDSTAPFAAVPPGSAPGGALTHSTYNSSASSSSTAPDAAGEQSPAGLASSAGAVPAGSGRPADGGTSTDPAFAHPTGVPSDTTTATFTRPSGADTHFALEPVSPAPTTSPTPTVSPAPTGTPAPAGPPARLAPFKATTDTAITNEPAAQRNPERIGETAPAGNSPTAPRHTEPGAPAPTEFDPPTIGLPKDRTDPAPPTATDDAGITVTGTFRAFDLDERAHVDKLQAMLDELKRSAGLPPGRRDVFGPPTPEAG